MCAAPEHRRDRRAQLRVRFSVAERRPQVPPVLVYCVGAVALLASASRTLTTKKLCIGSSWCISLSPIAQTLVSKPGYMNMKYELQTLPVAAKDVTDGDTIIVYVNMANHPKSIHLHNEVREAAIQRSKSSAAKNYFLSCNFWCSEFQTRATNKFFVKKYQIRLSGVDAPESSMPYGKEAKEELARLVQGKTLRVQVYDIDQYGRLLGDVYCDGVFVQEYMLKQGLAWHYTAYDHRIELNNVIGTLLLLIDCFISLECEKCAPNMSEAIFKRFLIGGNFQWENQAKVTRTGLWASPEPEKPWEWRKRKGIRAV